MSRALPVWVYVLFSMMTPVALGDALILETGETIRGEIEKQGDEYIITTEEGRTLTYSKREVKRRVYIADVTPVQALQMLQELQQIVLPYLNREEPEQFQTLAHVRRYYSQYDYQVDSNRLTVTRRLGLHTGSISASETGRASSGSISGSGSFESETRHTTEREMKIDQVFADEWQRYTDQFSVLRDDPRFKDLVTRRKNSNSLGDFASRAPDEYEDAKNAVNRALRALEDVFKAAKTSNTKVRARIQREISLEDDIMKAKNRLAQAKNRVKRARRPRSKRIAKAKRDKAASKVNSLRREKTTTLERLQLAATRGMSDFAKQESVALNEVQHAIEQLQDRVEQQGVE